MVKPEFDVKAIVLKPGESPKIQAAGNYFKILRVSPAPAVINVKTDQGGNFNVTPGMGIPASFNTLTLSSGNIVNNLTVLVYIGTVPLTDAPSTQPQQTLLTVDWLTVPALGGLSIAGILTLNGNSYRRKNITLANLTGVAGMNAATLCLFQAQNTARTAIASIIAAYTFNQGEYPLLPFSAGRLYPITIETDDIVIFSPSGIPANPVDISIVQTWLPVLS